MNDRLKENANFTRLFLESRLNKFFCTGIPFCLKFSEELRANRRASRMHESVCLYNCFTLRLRFAVGNDERLSKILRLEEAYFGLSAHFPSTISSQIFFQ